MYNKWTVILILGVGVFMGCKDEVVPKPKAMLRLEYPKPQTGELETDQFQFQYNEIAKLKSKTSSSLEFDYPLMKGSIFINYKKVDNNLEKLLSDAQKLSYEHSVKADGIMEQPFINDEYKRFGMF